MGPRRCNIDGCKSVAGRQQHRGVTFHTFPTNITIRQNWLTNCRFPATKSITKSVLICSRHFRRVDFQPLKNNKYLLKPGSEPTIFPWTQATANAGTSNSSNSSAEASASSSNDATASKQRTSKDSSPSSSSAAATAADISEAAGGGSSSSDTVAAASIISVEDAITPKERIVNQILSEAMKSEMKSPMKRSASADVGSGAEPKIKQLRKSLDSAMIKKTNEASTSAAAAAASANSDLDSMYRLGAEIEAQDFQEVWHSGQVIEVDSVDREVLIQFYTAGIKLIDEWIPMNSSRLRARRSSAGDTSIVTIAVEDSPSPPPAEPSTFAAAAAVLTMQSTPAAPSHVPSIISPATMQPATPLPGNLPVLKKAPYNYVAGEKCMAKWTDSRRWRATVQTVLDLDYYDVLFDDGYSKRCHAKDMSKIKRQPPIPGSSGPPSGPPFSAPHHQHAQPPLLPPAQIAGVQTGIAQSSSLANNISSNVTSASTTASATSAAATSNTSAIKSGNGGRKINPPLPIPKFDLASLNLLDVPKDGEWCCNWVNDTPIGAEGYLEGPDGNRRPTVLVDDWRLPAGWTKHLYQRSSVSGKWDVVLVGPTKKRFRSKNDVKVFLDEHGLQYNPDVYDFSIHKRRAKDLGLFVFTEDYKEAQHQKQQQILQKLADQKHTAIAPGDVLNQSNISNISTEEVFQGFPAPGTPVASPPISLQSGAGGGDVASTSSVGAFHSFSAPSFGESSSALFSTTAGPNEPKPPSPLGEGYVYVGSLKVQMQDNLFRCPEATCNKNFRKENHLQIHVKHYHDQLAKQMGECLNMTELAYMRTTGELPPPEETVAGGGGGHKSAAAESYAYPELHVDQTAIVANAAAHSSAAADAADPDFSLDGSGINRTSTPIKSTAAGGSQVAGGMLDYGHHSAPPATSGQRLSHAKKYKKSAKNVKSRLKLKLKNPNRSASYTKSGRSVRQYGASLSDRYDDYDMNDDGEYQDSDYVPEGSGGGTSANTTSSSAAQAASVRSNRLKFLNHPHALASGALSSDPNAALLQSPPPQQPPQTDVYVDENGEVIKLVRMRQEEIINCVCLYAEEDGLMIQCELCLTWQHGRCQGFEKESAVPEKYVCYICQNPQSGRPSMRFVHDQEWLYEGRLPVTEQMQLQQQQQSSPNPLFDGDASLAASSGSPTQNAAGGAEMVQLLPKHRERFDMLKISHTLTGNLLELKRFMHSLQVKINIAENKDHPKMYLWARKWEKHSPPPSTAVLRVNSIHNSTATTNSNDVPAGIVPLVTPQHMLQHQTDADEKNVVKLESTPTAAGIDPSAPTIEEVQVINDLMSNDADAMKHIERAVAEIAKTEIKRETDNGGGDAKGVKQEDEVDGHILAGLLTSPGGTNIDLVGAVAAVEKREQQQMRQQQSQAMQQGRRPVSTPVIVPQPEAAIEPAECQLRLLEHIQKQQMLAMTRLDSIEADIIGLEAIDEHAERVDADDNFGSTKRQIFQLISDLTKIRKLAAINLTEDEQLNPKVPAPQLQMATIG